MTVKPRHLHLRLRLRLPVPPTAAVLLLPTKTTPVVMVAAEPARVLNVGRTELPAALTLPTVAPVSVIPIMSVLLHLLQLSNVPVSVAATARLILARKNLANWTAVTATNAVSTV